MTVLFRRYGLYGKTCKTFLTTHGRILVHTDKAELEFLFPIAKNGETVVRELPPDIPNDQTMPVREHPEMGFVRWPLRREDFRYTS